MRTPKLLPTQDLKYRYYAGFSSAFVSDVLDQHANPESRVLDPWNGSGMTTAVCASRGIQATGVDINPATLPIAWARLASKSMLEKLRTRLEAISIEEFFSAEFTAHEHDIINFYFDSSSAHAIQSVRERVILELEGMKDEISSTQEFFALSGSAFLALSNAVAESLRPLKGTNPAWFNKPKSESDLIRLVKEDFLANFFTGLIISARHAVERDLKDFRWPKLMLGDARNFDLLEKFDLVITSPPYCTRIDYAVATLPEIISMGRMQKSEYDFLRRKITGSVLTEVRNDSSESTRSKYLVDVLAAIEGHYAKASSTYYLRYFKNYFDDLLKSLDQVGKVVPFGKVVMVVQNSFFKEIEIDLRRVIVDELTLKGFSLMDDKIHPAKWMIADSNPKSKQYRNSNVRFEHVLTFQK